MSPRQANIVDLTANVALTGIYAASTVWYRMSMFGAAAMTDAQRRSEASRMVGEKLVATFAGGMDALAASWRAASAAARGRLSVQDLPGVATDIIDAGLRPAMVRARANSRRLRRKSRKS